jgi:cobalt-zinc-cadmium resistance protein CzcA
VGTAEIATDPVPPNVADNFVILKPRSQWPNPDKEKSAVVAEIERVAKGVYGNNYELHSRFKCVLTNLFQVFEQMLP